MTIPRPDYEIDLKSNAQERSEAENVNGAIVPTYTGPLNRYITDKDGDLVEFTRDGVTPVTGLAFPPFCGGLYHKDSDGNSHPYQNDLVGEPVDVYGYCPDPERENVIFDTETPLSQIIVVTDTDLWTLSCQEAGSATFDGQTATFGNPVTFTPSITSGTITFIGAVKPQMEMGSYATSYIKTEGFPVTRVGDSLGYNTTGTGIFENPIFTLYNEVVFNVDNKLEFICQSNTLQFYKNTSERLTFQWATGEAVNTLGASLAPDTIYKIIVKYDGVTLKFFINGVLYHSSAIALTPQVRTELRQGYSAPTNERYLKSIKNQKHWINSCITDAQAIEITT